MNELTQTLDELKKNNFLEPNDQFISAITAASPIVIYVYDLTSFRFTYLNHQAERVFGYSSADVQAMNEKSFEWLTHPEDREVLRRHFAALRFSKNENVHEVEYRFRHKNGEWRWIKSYDKVLQRDAETGRITQIAGYAEDITKNRQAQEDAFKLAAIIESSDDAVISKTFDGTILSWNKGAENIFGYRAADVVGQNISIIFPRERLAEEREIIEKIKRGEHIKSYETIRTRKDGVEIPISLTVSAIKNTSGEVIGVSKIARDITKRKDAESKLLEEKNFSDTVINSLPGIFYLFDRQGKFLRWNESFRRVSGYSAEEIGRLHPLDLFIGEDKNNVEQRINEVFISGEATVEADLVSKNGTRTPYFFTGKQIVLGDVPYLIGTGIDISERKGTEKALLQSEERYRAFIEQSGEGIWRFEITEPFSIELTPEEQIEQIYRQSRLAECNDAMAQQYGFSRAEELIGKRIEDFLMRSEPANEEHLREFIRSNYKLTDTETVERDKNGQVKYFLNNLVAIVERGKVVRIWGTQRDVTLAKQTEQAFLEAEKLRRQSQKIEAIGRLAGGVAHDFNNFLAVIMLHVDMLNLQLPADSPLRYRIDEIKQVTNSAAGMVRQLLAFSRKQPMQPHPIVLNQVVEEFIKILRPLIGEDVEVRLNLSRELGVCFVDPNQITQVLMNLVVNARDAMTDRTGSGGVINIETSNLALNRRTVKHQAQPAGSYIQLAVSDNGSGMDFKTQERIFEPFFTTKEIGKGTGLGLATVYGIVKQSNGFIWVESEIDRGTTFQIQFPRIDEAAEMVKQEKSSIDIPGGSETVLIVEDEEPIRRVALEVLKFLGYQVFEASNGIQAIQLAELFTKPIHLLITDVVMPRMNGKELADKIKALHPETAVLFMSGYTGDIIANHGILEENSGFLSKPFSHQQLAVKVREVLDS